MIALDETDEPTSLIRTGVRIFEPGVDGTSLDIQQGKDQSKAVDRRTARLHRRQLRRAVIVFTPCTIKLRVKLAGAADACGRQFGHAMVANKFEMTLNLDEALFAIAEQFKCLAVLEKEL